MNVQASSTSGPDVRPVVLLGASYAAAWRLSNIAGCRVVNRAIPGDQTPSYVERFHRDVVALQPRAVIIWGIDNDLQRAPRDRAGEACQRVERNLEALVRLAREHDIEPILATDMTLGSPAGCYERVAAMAGWLRGKEGYQQRINRHVLRLNDFIRALAARSGAPLLDLHPLVSARNGMRERRYTKADGSHLTDAAYRVITAYAVPRLETWLRPPFPASEPLARAAG